MKKVFVVTVLSIIVIAISYGLFVLLSALGLWALVHLGVLSAWTWKQAALIAVIICVIKLCTGKATGKED